MRQFLHAAQCASTVETSISSRCYVKSFPLLMSQPTDLTTIQIKSSPTASLNLTWGESDSTFKLSSTPNRDLESGELLVKNLMFSNDPSQRSWIQKGAIEEALYSKPIREGQNMESFAVYQVLKSNNDKYKQGELLVGMTYWGDNVIIPGNFVQNTIDPESPLPLTAHLDFLGITGLTAYVGLFDVANLKASDVLVVSGAAGATGAVVVQIAKHVIGAKKVIGIAGGKTKCDYVKSLGADECVDYRDPNFFLSMKQALGEDKECDVFFDGVGGSILDQMLILTKRHGQVIACGAIAGYNDSSKFAIKGWPLIITRRLNVKGYIILDYLKDAKSIGMKLISYVQDGKIKIDNDSFELVDLTKEKDALKKIPLVFNTLFTGEKKFGKLITQIAEPKL